MSTSNDSSKLFGIFRLRGTSQNEGLSSRRQGLRSTSQWEIPVASQQPGLLTTRPSQDTLTGAIETGADGSLQVINASQETLVPTNLTRSQTEPLSRLHSPNVLNVTNRDYFGYVERDTQTTAAPSEEEEQQQQNHPFSKILKRRSASTSTYVGRPRHASIAEQSSFAELMARTQGMNSEEVRNFLEHYGEAIISDRKEPKARRSRNVFFEMF